MSRSAEVIVVGGGSAGAVVAARLAESGTAVTLIEAGPDYGGRDHGRWPAEILDATALATSHDWGYGSGPIEGRAPWTWERARILGGCSAHNGAIAAVGHRNDYDGWGLPGWSTDALRPFFDTALLKMRVRPYAAAEATPFHARCLHAAAATGWMIASDLCDLDANESFGLETVNVVEGVRWNTAFAYLDPVRADDHLRIVDRTLVDRIVRAGESGWVVHAIGPDGPATFTADTVVLSAGVYGTPAILQRSGIGSPDDLRQANVETVIELPSVGANLHDHPMADVSRELTVSFKDEIAAAVTSGFVPEEQTLGRACSSLATDGIFDLHLFPVAASTQTALTNGRAQIEVACMNPRSRGTVRITSSDPEAQPLIDHRYLSDPDDHDLRVLQDGLAMAAELFGDSAVAEITVDEPEQDMSAAAIRRDVAHYYHPVGTTPMGTDSATSVCDPKGRVHRTDDLYVADVSLMPQIPRANTNIPAVMVGERIASFLA